jgi:hypothetical protein
VSTINFFSVSWSLDPHDLKRDDTDISTHIGIAETGSFCGLDGSRAGLAVRIQVAVVRFL